MGPYGAITPEWRNNSNITIDPTKAKALIKAIPPIMKTGTNGCGSLSWIGSATALGGVAWAAGTNSGFPTVVFGLSTTRSTSAALMTPP
jgi:hypothetical protein